MMSAEALNQIALYPEALLGIALYLLPSIVAFVLRHRRAFWIFLVNTLGGWTLLGWIVALVWALTGLAKTGGADDADGDAKGGRA